MTPYEGSFVTEMESATGNFIALAVGNSRQAGGGMQVTRKAFIDDGLLDLTVVNYFEMRDFGVVIEELQDFDNPENHFVHYRQLKSVEIEVPSKLPINLDGEPYRWDRIQFEIRPNALQVVLPADCPVLKTP